MAARSLQNFRMTIEYEGTEFNGWQTQGQGCRTVQAEIEKVLKVLFKKKIHLAGSGRTDAGVHALGQVATFKAATILDGETLRKALNANLPEDIVIHTVEKVSPTFHAQFSAKGKIYCYTVLNRSFRSVHTRKFSYHFPYLLNITRMRKAARLLIGRHDFRAFMATDSAQKKTLHLKDTIRAIRHLQIRKKNDLVSIEIEGDGFLYKMVRNIVTVLLDVGTKRLEPTDVKHIIQHKDRQSIGATAPAHGLCLHKVLY